MPNNVTNVISAAPSVIESMLDSEGNVDFNLIIDRHEDLELNGACSVCCEAESAAELMCKEKPNDNEVLARLETVNRLRSSALEMDDRTFEQFVMMMRNKRKHGFYHMMDFARSAWGTKWNAYGQNSDLNTKEKVTFETAWSHPLPVLKALSLKFPDQSISVQYADEDLGCNCGQYVIKNGEMIKEDIAENWSERSDSDKQKWTKFAFNLCHPDKDPAEWGYDENWNSV